MIKDLGELRFFLGIDVKRYPTGFYLSQQRYADDILERAAMMNCRTASTPIDAKGKLSADGPPLEDAKTYRSITGALQYLTVTPPDLAFAVQQACLHMHDPPCSPSSSAEKDTPLCSRDQRDGTVHPWQP